MVRHDVPGLRRCRVRARRHWLGAGEQVSTLMPSLVIFPVTELPVALHLLHCVLHSSLRGTALGRTRGDLRSRSGRDRPLWHLDRLLPRLLHLYFLLLLPLILHVLIQRDGVILLLFGLLGFLRSSQARNALVLVGNLGTLPVQEAAIARKLALLLLLMARGIVGLLDGVRGLGAGGLRFYLPDLALSDSSLIAGLAEICEHPLNLLKLLSLLLRIGDRLQVLHHLLVYLLHYLGVPGAASQRLGVVDEGRDLGVAQVMLLNRLADLFLVLACDGRPLTCAFL